MNTFTAIALYITIWWTALFAVLPFGTRPVSEADKTTGWRGAPEKPMMWRKVLVTTLVSAVIWGVIYWIVASGWINFREGWMALPED
jgi:predicted secreted protein